MYAVNDKVLYTNCGVCNVESVEMKDFTGEPAEYYVLRPVGDNRNKFYVPTKNEQLTRQMHRVLSRDEIESLINDMPDEDFIWIDDENVRKEQYQQILRRGDRHELVRMIKTLYIHRCIQKEQRKKLHAADEYFLKEAENVLYDEFSYVLDIPKDDIVGFIQSRLADK